VDLALETARLVLRPLALADVGALRALAIDPDVRRWAADGRVLPEATVRKAVLASVAGFRWAGAGMYAIRLREDGAFAGYAGLRPARVGDRPAPWGGVELGAAIWPRHWGRGIAAEACRAVLDDAFGRLGLSRVLACADAPNVRSLALVARLGFRPLANAPGAFGAVRWFARTRGPAEGGAP
jgi:RimJ/RimL family protein N-acetyltransferase